MDAQENFEQAVKQTNTDTVNAAQGINIFAALEYAMKLPGVRIDREQFLRKELRHKHSKVIVQRAIDHNPAYARIERYEIDKLATHAINYECNKTTALSVAAGLPGGVVGVAAIPADIIQYFGFMLRIIQKLAYLYGFEDFHLNEDDVSDDILNEIVIFIGVMFGAQEAAFAIKALAKVAGENVAKKLARQALMKNLIYRVVKKIAPWLGVHMNKQIFSNAVGRAVPIVGGIFAGGLTYATFKPCSNRLKATLRELPISDPEFYKSGAYKDVVVEEFTDLEEIVDDGSEVVGYAVDTTTPPRT